MGCFSIFPCFTNSKHQKLKISVSPTTASPSPDQGNEKNCESVLVTVSTEESTNLDSLQNTVRESRDASEDQLINGSDEKTVTIDLDAKTNTDVSIKEVEILSLESKEKESGTLGVIVQLENDKERKNEDKQEDGKLGFLVEIQDENIGFQVETENEKERQKEVKQEENRNEIQSRAFSDSSVSSYISYPPMHRYHNCLINEDEDDVMIQEDSSESLFSLPINPRRQSKSNPVELDDKEVNSPLKTRFSLELNAKPIKSCPNGVNHNQIINSQLNPVENHLTQLDAHQEKENLGIPLSEEPNFKVLDQKGKLKNESVVTTSLSSWLIEPESQSYSDGANSWKSFEDRPILGALSIEEVRQISARSSPRKSPCRNPDDMPIIGSVGSYWSHTGQDTDSSNSCSMSRKSRRNRENNASSCHSTPFKKRLERAMDKGVA